MDSNYGKVDFEHMAATINAHLYYSTGSIPSWVVGDDNINALAGWAGDLQTLILDVKK